MMIVSCIHGKSSVFFILYWKALCLASSTVPFILFCVRNDATGLEGLCLCFTLLIELFASMRVHSECMAVLSPCMISKSKGSFISHCVEMLLEFGKFNANLMPLMMDSCQIESGDSCYQNYCFDDHSITEVLC